jgi:hypothetical protein
MLHGRSLAADGASPLESFSPRDAQRDVRRISGRKGVYRKISRLLESLVHTQLILAMWLKFRKEKGSGACWGQRLRKSKSSMLWVVSAKRVWSSLDWLNASTTVTLPPQAEEVTETSCACKMGRMRAHSPS